MCRRTVLLLTGLQMSILMQTGITQASFISLLSIWKNTIDNQIQNKNNASSKTVKEYGGYESTISEKIRDTGSFSFMPSLTRIMPL